MNVLVRIKGNFDSFVSDETGEEGEPQPEACRQSLFKDAPQPDCQDAATPPAEASVQTESEQTEVVSAGIYFERGGSRYVYYEEVDEQDQDIVKNLLIVTKKGDITLRKRGLIDTEMRFVPGSEQMSNYMTPYGGAVMGVFTNSARAQVFETGSTAEDGAEQPVMTVDLDYIIYMDYKMLSQCRVQISVLPTEEAKQD